MKDYIVELEGVSKSFGEIKAVDNLTLQVPPGSIYGILGPNGAGKTTTLRLLLNILKPDAGEIKLFGQKVSLDALKRVGYLPEERGLYQKEKVIEVVVFLAQLKGLSRAEAKKRALQWLERLGLSEWANRKVEELSKGMQQKVQFILTLIHDPELLILDEPFSGLDPINTELLKDIILEEKRRGKTILFSTHILEQAEKMCEYVALISKGRKLVDGKLSEIKARYGKHTIKIEYEGDGEVFSSLPYVHSLRKYERFVELETEEPVNRVLSDILGKVQVFRVERTEPSLNQIYLSVVGGSNEADIHNNSL